MGLYITIKKVINRFLMKAAVSRVKGHSGVAYLTFDDGPEPGITEFVLDELDKYGFKATFFCTGANAVKHPDLVAEITRRGHAIGNHSFEHIHAYNRDAASYVEDVERADNVLHTHLFRPPNGCLLFTAWKKLRKKYKIVYWSIGSGDWIKENRDDNKCKQLLSTVDSGDIILFHFSQDLQEGTRALLPWFLEHLQEKHLTSEVLG